LSAKYATYLKASLCEAVSLLSPKETLIVSLLAMDLYQSKQIKEVITGNTAAKVLQ